MGRCCQVHYVVERDGSQWTINFEGEHCGRFPTQEMALRSALAEAARVRRMGHEAEVHVRQPHSLRPVRLDTPQR